MLDFSFTEEQNMLRTMIRDFGRKELAPGYKDRVRESRLPPEIIKKVADLGLMGLNVPEEYGGDPHDPFQLEWCWKNCLTTLTMPPGWSLIISLCAALSAWVVKRLKENGCPVWSAVKKLSAWALPNPKPVLIWAISKLLLKKTGIIIF
jgi:hypothetical protein